MMKSNPTLACWVVHKLVNNYITKVLPQEVLIHTSGPQAQVWQWDKESPVNLFVGHEFNHKNPTHLDDSGQKINSVESQTQPSADRLLKIFLSTLLP